jgi:hypothetical protein
MAKDRKKLREQNNAKKAQWLAQRQQSWVKPDICKEVAYIIGRAQEADSRVVTLGKLILFSTPEKGAWMLDVEDGYAICLAEEGVAQPTQIFDTATQFGIEWDRDFRIENDRLVIIARTGGTTVMTGCPEILDAINQA